MQAYLLTAFAALIILSPAAASAQQTAVSLTDSAPSGWDASGHVSWLSVDKTGIAPEWNRWYDAASFGGSLGRFFGPHVKVELDAATSTSGEVYVERRVAVPGQTFPIYFTQPQRFRMATLSGGAVYQFLDNRWIHPFVGAGIEASRETRTVEEVFYPVVPPGAVALDPPGTTSTWRSRPFADVGFKFFVSERAFVRSDIRTTFDRGGVSHVSWRSGFGVDF